MPTTLSESQKIVSIVTEYIPLETAQIIFQRLFNEVGKVSENDSVRDSLFLMNQLLQNKSN